MLAVRHIISTSKFWLSMSQKIQGEKWFLHIQFQEPHFYTNSMNVQVYILILFEHEMKADQIYLVKIQYINNV